MIIDVHSHLMWYPDHVGERFAQEALASKLVKLQVSGGAAHAASLDLHSYDSTPETHWAASTTADAQPSATTTTSARVRAEGASRHPAVAAGATPACTRASGRRPASALSSASGVWA